MKILFNAEWQETPLDYAPLAGEQIVQVAVFVNLMPIDNAYFKRAADLNILWNYVKEIGLKPTLLKVLSRHAEKRRNTKFLSVGFGYIGDAIPVYFVAPLHPECIDRLPLAAALIHIIENAVVPTFASNLQRDSVYHALLGEGARQYADEFAPLAGWHPFSGSPAPEICWPKVKSWVAHNCPSGFTRHQTSAREICTQSLPAKAHIGGIPATLFGYGNYAKTVIIPNLPSKLRISRIHEIDPLQISKPNLRDYICSTESVAAANDQNKVFFIAGFHHTHAALACEGLSRNASVVVEKPLVTTAAQLTQLKHAYTASSGHYFACFHKRYQEFNAYIRHDLNIGAQDPINYHALVYEVPLPENHWYLWPNSRSRIISNGCHWIDHFLYLNHFVDVDRHAVFCAPDGTVNVSISLQNGACFSMVLTEKGSQRLGVQDYVEVRQNNAVVTIVNGDTYRAEIGNRIVRKLSRGRMHSYRRMYREIGNRIFHGQAGDSWQSIYVSASLALAVDAAATNDLQR